MNREELLQALRRMTVETGSLLCLGCEHERNCSIHGCAVINLAVQKIQSLAQENQALQTRLDAERLAEIDTQAVIDFLRKADLKGGRRVAAAVVIETRERRMGGNDEAIQ